MSNLTPKLAGMVLLPWLSWPAGAVALPLERVPQVRGVPFQAVQVITRESASGRVVTRGRIARSDDGSTYVELVDPGTGIATDAFLLDVPGRRGIVLDLVHHRYSIRPAPDLRAAEFAEEQVPLELQRAEAERGQLDPSRHGVAGAVVTHLGTRLVAGLMSVGNRQLEPAESRVTETWFSVELGLAVDMIEADTAGRRQTEVTLTEVLRASPDPSLFRIPAGFQPEGSRGIVPGRAGPMADGE